MTLIKRDVLRLLGFQVARQAFLVGPHRHVANEAASQATALTVRIDSEDRQVEVPWGSELLVLLVQPAEVLVEALARILTEDFRQPFVEAGFRKAFLRHMPVDGTEPHCPRFNRTRERVNLAVSNTVEQQSVEDRLQSLEAKLRFRQ